MPLGTREPMRERQLPLPSRSPIPLTAGQEQQIRDIYHKSVRDRCAEEIKDFAACATNRTFSATWKCRDQRLAMNGCMIKFATREEQDKAREEWFTTRETRRLEREALEAKRKVKQEFHKEWWGLDEDGQLGGRDKKRGHSDVQKLIDLKLRIEEQDKKSK